jgi:hypothetical protein
VLNSSLDRLGAWVGAAPGEPASPEQQAAFDAANSSAYAHFPAGTRVGRLVSVDFRGSTYDLLGFRDGDSLCLRLTGGADDGFRSPADCVPQRELVDLGAPAAVLSASVTVDGGTAVYGVAADSVTGIKLELASGEEVPVELDNNAFLYLTDQNLRLPEAGPVRALVEEPGGRTTTVSIRRLPTWGEVGAADLPGPTQVDYRIQSPHVGWLERGEARGEPFDWPGSAPEELVTSRLVEPGADSSFRVGIAYGFGSDGAERVPWFCLAWIWPLVKGPMSWACIQAQMADGDITIESAGWTDQFPMYAGLAADGVASLELFFPNGAHEEVPVVDNVYAVQIPMSVHTKLVAYDADHHVVGIHVF